jgi:hypothetical protein
MAQVQFGDILEVNFTNSLRAVAGNGGSGDQLTDPSDYSNISALDAALTAHDSVTYSAAQLQLMTVNDKIFALRNCADPTTIADYMVAQGSRDEE